MGTSRLRTLKLLGDWCCNTKVAGSASTGCDFCSINSSTCAGRGRGAAFGFPVGNFTPGTILIFLLLLFSHFSTTTQESCPSGCECKWKSGKESVACARARLRAIPQGLDPNTQVLELPGNMIERLPSKVFLKLNLLNLQKIFLSECQLVSLETDTFAKLSNLIELELSGNRFSAVPSHTFDQISELRDLKLNANPIVRISNDAFVSLPRLIRLELTGCRIGAIETWAFRGLSALQWLRLDNNRLLTIQAESFFPLRSLHGLEIAGNPWNCSCTLQPWRDWMLKNNVPFGVPPLCTYPKRLAGTSWDRLQLEDFACLPKLASSTDQERISRVVEGENATLLCRLQTTPDTQIRWLNGNKGSGVVANGSVGTASSSSSFVLTESFVKSGTFPYNDLSHTGEFDAMKYKPTARPNTGDRSLGVKITKLTIIRATAREAGLYICTAETKAGLVSANFTLHVVPTKTENLAGRVLFTGALVAALLLIIVCLLLVCVIFGNRRLHFAATVSNNLTTEEKIELNHVGHHLRNHDHEGQNGGSNIPLMRDHDGHVAQHDHEDDCKAIILGPLLTNHYSKSQSTYAKSAPPGRPQRPRHLPNSVIARASNNNMNGTRNDLGQNSVTGFGKNIPEANHSAPPSSSSVVAAAARTLDQSSRARRNGNNGSSHDCEYKALPVNDPDEEEEDDDYDDNNNSSNDGGGESGSDESSTPVVEIINNNHRRSKAAQAAACRAGAEAEIVGPPPFPADNGADSSRNIISSGSSSNSCSNNNNQHNHSNNINKRHSMFGASAGASAAASSGNNNNNNHASKCYESAGVTLATNAPIGMRSVVGTPQRKSTTELSGNHNPFITSSPSASYSQKQKQWELCHFQPDSNKDRYSELVNEKLPFSSIDYTSLPRPNKNRDPRIGSYFHQRNNSTDSQYPLLSSSYGRSLDGVSASSADLLTTATPFASSSNPDSLARVPPSSYAYHSRPASTNYIYRPQNGNPHHPYLRHYFGSGQSLRNNSPSYVGAGTPAGMKWNQRLSMPTSPEKHFASSIPPSSYDYHAAQLAAFLEEYRILQMELIRMSSSLTGNAASSLNLSGDGEHAHAHGASGSMAGTSSSINLPNPSNNNHGGSSTAINNNFSTSRNIVSAQQQQHIYGNSPLHQTGLGPVQSEHRHSESGGSPSVTSNNSSRHTSPYKPRQQQSYSSPAAEMSSGSANSANYFSNAAYGLTGTGAKPPVPVRPSLLSNATSNVLGPSEYQNKQNLKSILKNPASIAGNSATGAGVSSFNTNGTPASATGQPQENAVNSNHNNNYDITFH